MKTHAVIDSPLGPLTLVAEDDALIGLYMEDQRHRPVIDAARDDTLLPGLQEQLEAYWRRELKDFDKHLPFFQLVGFEPVDFGPKWSVCQLHFRQDLSNPNGVLHGGVIATLIDAGITQAMLMTDEYQVLRATKGFITTVDLHVKYLRPATDGVLVCKSTIRHLGQRIIHAQSVVEDAAGKELALGDATMLRVIGKGPTND